MEKKNSYDLSIPNRESPVAIFFILFRTIYQIITRIWPALLVLLFRGDKENIYSTYVLWGVIGIGGLVMIFSVVNYFKTYYFVQNNELHLHKGVLNRLKTNIPFERIQTVQFEQNIFHTMFNVVKLKMDTAGSDKTEIDFSAIEIEKAEYLREYILQNKEAKKVKTSDPPNLNVPQEGHEILSLGISDLWKVGLTRNHLKSGGIILVFLVWVYENIKDLGIDPDGYYDDIVSENVGFNFYLYLGVLFLVVSIIISLVMSVITNFDLSFIRVREGFKMKAGLFTKKETSAKDHKIQLITWNDNLLKSFLGFFDLGLHQASGHEMDKSQKINIPGMSMVKIDQLSKTIFKVHIPPKASGNKIHFSYFFRYAIWMTIIFMVLITGLYLLKQGAISIGLLVLYVFILGSRYLSYKKKSYCILDGHMTIRGGAFGQKNSIFPLFKIQSLNVQQSPYQKKKNLGNIQFNMASGAVTLPYISLDEVTYITDLSMYHVETSGKRWM